MTVTAILPLPAWLARCPESFLEPDAGSPPLLRVVDALGSCAEVVIAAAAEVAPPVRRTLGGHEMPTRVVAAAAPGGWAQCVTAGLAGLDGDAPVLLHDVEWPVVDPALVERMVAALGRGAGSVLPVLPVTDSVKAVDAEGTVTATLDRAQLRTVQYPRGFAAATLAGLAAGSASQAGGGRFDDLELVLSSGTPVTLVDGDADAITAQLPRDADYLTAVLRVRQRSAGR
ncbi:IspD/TarI family cytidylyltransferase [Micromonospora sp. WMMD737]|uniref:IspD/TarI family cytidylyltransferase n=1 Tax=Micromonospora sp. WMMD737 TaxID=3404113 RepID=UPI003B922C1D